MNVPYDVKLTHYDVIVGKMEEFRAVHVLRGHDDRVQVNQTNEHCSFLLFLSSLVCCFSSLLFLFPLSFFCSLQLLFSYLLSPLICFCFFTSLLFSSSSLLFIFPSSSLFSNTLLLLLSVCERLGCSRSRCERIRRWNLRTPQPQKRYKEKRREEKRT